MSLPPFSLNNYHPPTKLREGTIFSGVSVCLCVCVFVCVCVCPDMAIGRRRGSFDCGL